jgi:heterodisulfide reductase subunit A
VARHSGIRVLTNAVIERVVGFVGAFEATVRIRPRYVDPAACIGCEECAAACPDAVPEPLGGVGVWRKAIGVPFPGAVPAAARIDPPSCRRTRGETCVACAEACPAGAVRLDDAETHVVVRAGAIVVATGCTSFDPAAIPSLGAGVIDAVHTLDEVERLASSNGPTGGIVRRRDGAAPSSAVVVHCVGRSTLGRCSGACCQAALKVAPVLARQNDGAAVEVVHLLTDLVAPGVSGAALVAEARRSGARFVHLAHAGAVEVAPHPRGAVVTATDATGAVRTFETDLVVLACGAVPAPSARALAAALDVAVDGAGFFAPDHALLGRERASEDGVYLAGTVAGSAVIPAAVASARAAAGLALARIRPGERLVVEALTATADGGSCSRCLLCLSACPFGAVVYDAATDRVAVVDVLCRGCGTCAAACASGAAAVRQSTSRQLRAEIAEVLRG